MTDTVVLPKTDAGNDPNDWRDDPDAVMQFGAAVAEAVKKDRDNKKTITVGKASEESGVVTALLQNPTEDNVALAFANHHVGQFIYLHGQGKWFLWDGKRWCEDVLERVRNAIRDMARRYNTDGRATPAKSSFICGVERICRSAVEFARSASDFDVDNYLLNCPDGTYNLKTLEMTEHSPGNHITKLAGASPTEKGGEVFRKFLKEVTQEDEELELFLQKAMGSCLSGAVEEHWLLFLVGNGRNGKNTLGDAVLDVMGEYSRTVPSSTLMAQKHQAHATEIMNMKGMRMVASGEIEEGSFWAEAKIKELTGDEYLNGHYMRQDWISFPRTHKHLIYGNHRPQLRNTDVGIRSRLKIIPFNACFLGREDTELPQKLRKESGYILQWLMEGHKAWVDAGKRLGTCAAVEKETQEYLEAQSTVDAWIAACCNAEEVDGQSRRYWAKANDLYLSYANWKDSRRETPMAQGRFAESLSKKYPRIKSDGYRYEGLRLKAHYELDKENDD
jgi:putative DNA primase/helicase